MQYIIDYVLEYNQYPKAGETIVYYSWLLKFIGSDDNYLDLWEINNDGEEFIEGVENAIEIVENQINLCHKYEEYAQFPQFNQMIVISKGVYEGLDVEAVKYLPEGNMSGWWITTELYDDNIDSLMVVHYYHLAFSRPDLLKYLALPAGYRFFIEGENVEIYLDEKVL